MSLRLFGLTAGLAMSFTITPAARAAEGSGPPQGCVALLSHGYLRPAGEWSFQKVTVKGPRIKFELNGTVSVDADVSKVTEFMDGKPHPGKDRTSGYSGIAGHDDPVAFRNVMIKPLD